LAARLVSLVEAGVGPRAPSGVGPPDGKDNPPRALKYDDCAILCRASTSFAAYEDALERAGVPFLTVAGRGFYNRPEIRDLLNALQALADPTDSLALTGLLRSPAFALSDAALYHLRKGKEGRATPLWERLRAGRVAPAYRTCHAMDQGSIYQDRYGLSPEDAHRAARAVAIITRLHGQAGRTPVADLLKAFLDETDYRAALLQAGQARAARNVAKLLADAQTRPIVGAGEFLEFVADLRDAGAREGEARALTEGAVQIMTVHAAKGLEFPVVALGDATYGPRGRSSPLVDADGLLLPIRDEGGRLPTLYRLAKARADDQADAEADRLLYVAATRAREKLLLSGCIKLRKDGTPGKPGGWLGRLAGPECLALTETSIPHNDEGEETIALDLQVGATPVACTIYEPGVTWDQRPAVDTPPLADDTPLPPPLLAAVTPGEELVEGSAERAMARHTAGASPRSARLREQDSRRSQRVWQVVPDVARPRAPSWVIGSLVHEALAAWRFPDGSQKDEPGSDQWFARWAKARARGYGLTDARQLGDAVGRSRTLLQRFRAHALYDEMESAERRLHEVPYSLEVEGRVENGILDAIYLRDGAWTVVEFKTDDVRDEASLEQLINRADYAAQRRRYQAATERLLGERPRFFVVLAELLRAGAG
jgi:ATP-dependent exoDNAse (exonuclease V) beta subunit